MTRLLLLVVGFAFLGSLSAADNWPQWRGPNGDGTAPNATPPVNWDAASNTNIKWKAKLAGRGSATPIVWDDQIFVVSAEKTDREATASERPKPTAGLDRKTTAPTHFYRFLVTSFDRATGEQRWQKVATEAVPHEGHHETHSYAAGSPATDGENLYVSFGSFGIFCYDLKGNLKWKKEIERLNTRLGWGEAVTPAVHEGNVLLNWDQETKSALYCLDAKTGDVRWKADREEKSTWTTPLVVNANGKTQVILNGTTRVRSHDLKTGEVIWSCGGMTVNPIPSVLRYGDSLLSVSGYRGAAAVSVPLNSVGDLGTTGKVNWRYGKGTPYVPSPLLVGDRLYFTETTQNLLTILNAKTGEPILEKERLPGMKQFYASPIFAGGHVYFTDRSGTTLVLKAGDKLDVAATNKLDDPVDASAVAVGKQLYLRGEKHLYCIEETK